MSDSLGSLLQSAVAQMRTGSDEDALRALVLLTSEPPTDVLAALLARLMEHKPGCTVRRNARGRLPDDKTIEHVLSVVADPTSSALVELGGGTYDGLLALFVATLAAVDDVSDEADA